MLAAGLELHGFPGRYRNGFDGLHGRNAIFLDCFVQFQPHDIIRRNPDQFDIFRPAMHVKISRGRIAFYRGQIDHGFVHIQNIALTAGSQEHQHGTTKKDREEFPHKTCKTPEFLCHFTTITNVGPC